VRGEPEMRGSILPGYALCRTDRYGFFDAIFIRDLEYDYAGLIGPVIHFEDIRAKLSTGAASDTAFVIDIYHHHLSLRF
jgi:hypothetical protein